jgi:hypothetical protein
MEEIKKYQQNYKFTQHIERMSDGIKNVLRHPKRDNALRHSKT